MYAILKVNKLFILDLKDKTDFMKQLRINTSKVTWNEIIHWVMIRKFTTSGMFKDIKYNKSKEEPEQK